MNRKVMITVGFAVSLIVLYFITRNVDIDKVGDELKEANYLWLLPNILLILASMYLRAWRWQSMINPIRGVPFKKLLSSTAVGHMANNILPLRLGEFIRAYSLSKLDKNISKSTSLATIFIERIVFDLLVLLFIFGIILVSTDLDVPKEVRHTSLLILAIAMLGCFSSIIFTFYNNFPTNYIDKCLSLLPLKQHKFMIEIIGKISLGSQFLKEPWTGIRVLFQTFLIYFFVGLSNYFVFLAFGLNIPLEAAFTTLAIVSIMVIVPSSPGFIGVYHAGVKFTLEQYGVSTEISIACAIVMHATQYFVITFFGLYHLWRSHLSLTDFQN